MTKLRFTHKARRRKPTSAQQKVFDQLIAVIPEAINRLETPAEAENMESHIFRLRNGGMISDQMYQIWLNAIKEKYKENHWAPPTA